MMKDKVIPFDLEKNEDVIERFTKFCSEREIKKKQEYYKVLTFGWFVSAIGLVMMIITQIIENTNENAFVTYATIGNISSFIIVIGFLILSTVPYEEVDFDGIIYSSDYPSRKYFATICFSTLCIIGGVFVGTIPPYIGFLFIPLGLWVLFPRVIETIGFTMRIVLGCELGLLVFGCILFYLGTNPYGFLNNALSRQQLGETWLQFVEKVKKIEVIWAVMNSVLGTITFFVFLLNFIIFYYLGKLRPNEKGQSTLFLYIAFYSWLVVAGLYTLSNGILAIFVHIANDNATRFNGYYMYYIVHSFNMFLPIIINVSFGPANIFNMTAKLFEYDIKTLLEDGSVMAELAAQSTAFLGNVVWIYRKEECPVLKRTTKGIIERQFWMKAEILKKTETTVESIIDYCDDVKTNWGSKYNNKDLHFFIHQEPLLKPVLSLEPTKSNESTTTASTATTATTEESVDAETFVSDIASTSKTENFEDWRRKNFDVNKNQEVICEGNSIILKQHIKQNEKVTVNISQKYLLNWAEVNMRYFDFGKFDNVLLTTSPRDLKKPEDQNKTYDLSSHIKIEASWSGWLTNTNNRIDYFMSHSWADDCEVKCTNLRKFNEEFKAKNKNRNMTLWFDKVCINQADPANALLTLPIFIGACKKLLVVIGETYMNRLWCVWELFCLFCFCNTSLALDRIDVILLEKDEFGIKEIEKSLMSFDLDNAHCFDPNEELKLRSIIAAVGVSRFNQCVKSMGGYIVSKTKLNAKK